MKSSMVHCVCGGEAWEFTDPGRLNRMSFLCLSRNARPSENAVQLGFLVYHNHMCTQLLTYSLIVYIIQPP